MSSTFPEKSRGEKRNKHFRVFILGLTCMKLLHCGVASFSFTKSSGRAPLGTSRRVSQMLAFDTTDLSRSSKIREKNKRSDKRKG